MSITIEQAETALAEAKAAYLSEMKRDSERREGSGAQERRREEHQQSLRNDIAKCERDLEAAKRRQESERLKENRAYFENGCACIHSTKILQPCPTNMPDNEAVAFYEQHCKCTRNYVQS